MKSNIIDEPALYREDSRAVLAIDHGSYSARLKQKKAQAELQHRVETLEKQVADLTSTLNNMKGS